MMKAESAQFREAMRNNRAYQVRFVFFKMNFVLNTMNFALIMMNFAKAEQAEKH